ncbi:MAG: transglycosylase SLT domain-containing protein [Desulfuromonadaceae bacterium]|nr:transglycosylase SLT domain-containing protein [Desulfuromonadaceae bacterium]
MPYHFKSLLIILAGLSYLSLSILSAGADALLSRAAAQFRDKDFGEAYLLAGKSEESPQRSFLLGVSALRLGKPEDSLIFLAEAERKLPLLADYAVLYQVEALLKLKKYPEAAARGLSFARLYPLSSLLRRSEKLYADILFQAGDFKGAFSAFQAFVEKYPAGADSVDSLFHTARCREEIGDKTGAVQTYRNIWINNPASVQAKKSQDRLKELEKSGLKNGAYSPEELLKRASYLYSQNEFSASLKTLGMLTADVQSPAVAGRVELREGMAHYRLRQYKLAEKFLARAALTPLPGVSSEARFWMAKSVERQNQNERALTLYMELAAEGKQQEFADDSLMEAAGLRRIMGLYADSALLLEQVVTLHPGSKFLPRAIWEAGWCRYLAGEYNAAVNLFKTLLKDESQREKVLYWSGRALENSENPDAGHYYRKLLEEYPAGFYASWYRERKGVKDTRESLGQRNALTELPVTAGFEKPRLLASLGMLEEARSEMTVARKKNGDKKGLFPALSRIYLEMGDYMSAISLFMQNRPIAWEKSTLPLWTAGYPLAYSDLVAQNAAANSLSEGLVYALIRAESGFSPAIKSHAGAIGLMQMMPATAKQTARVKGTFNPQRLTVPEYNIRLGTRHLHDLMKQYDGDVVYVAAAYNAGAAAVERWRKSFNGLKKDEFIESIPYQETRDYVKKVYASAATYRQLYGLK